MRAGVRGMTHHAVAELEAFLGEYPTARDAQQRLAAVRNGYQCRAQVLNGIGAVRVRVSKKR